MPPLRLRTRYQFRAMCNPAVAADRHCGATHSYAHHAYLITSQQQLPCNRRAIAVAIKYPHPHVYLCVSNVSCRPSPACCCSRRTDQSPATVCWSSGWCLNSCRYAAAAAVCFSRPDLLYSRNTTCTRTLHSQCGAQWHASALPLMPM
jgi:hypothetical protein